jgi:translation initiation factor 5A
MGGGDWEAKEIRELKVGRYVNIDDEPCKIISISTSKPGKHGSAKANIDAVSIFSGSKKSLVALSAPKCRSL